MRKFSSLFVLLLVLSAAGCSSIRPPAVQSVRFLPGKLNIIGGTGNLSMTIGNENADPIDITGVKVEMKANKSLFASGMAPLDIRLPAYGTTTVAVPMKISNTGVLKSLMGIGKAKGVNYSMDAEFTFTGEDGKRQTATDHSSGSLGADLLKNLK